MSQDVKQKPYRTAGKASEIKYTSVIYKQESVQTVSAQ